MKKIIILIIVLATSMAANAQFTSGGNNSRSYGTSNFSSLNQSFDSYKYWQLGYTSEGGMDGAYIGYMMSAPFYKGLSYDYGARFQWNTITLPWDESSNFVGMKFQIGLSYQVNVTEDVAIIPNTAPQLGFISCVDAEGETDFVMGWDFGTRIKYKNKYFLTYAYTVGITGQDYTHSVGIGIDF